MIIQDNRGRKYRYGDHSKYHVLTDEKIKELLKETAKLNVINYIIIMLLTVSAVQFYVGFFLEKDDVPYVICTILVFALVALIWYLFFKPKREQKAKEFAEQKWNTAQIIKGTYVDHREFAQQTSEHHWVTDYIVEYKDDKQMRKKAFVPKCEFDRYVDTYPGDPVWVLRYPNFKGGFAEMVFNFDSMEDCTTIFKK